MFHLGPLIASLVFATALAMAGPVLRFTELQSSNGATLRDENGDSPDWFELTNSGDEPADLTGWGVTDDPKQPFKWRFIGGSLAPGEFLVVYASGKDRQPVAGHPVEPATIPGIVGWFRADAVDPADPAQVRRVGDALRVRRWDDEAGGVGAARPAAEESQPELRLDAVNGLPALHFDGLDDQLLLPQPAATNSFTLMAVARPSLAHEVEAEAAAGVGGTSGQRWLFGARHGGDLDSGAGLSLGINGASVYEHGSAYMPALAVAAADLGPRFTLVTVVYDVRRPALFLQGSRTSDGVTSPRAHVIAPVEIGAGTYGAFAGEVAEILLFNRALTEVERRDVEATLAARYHLPLAQPRHTNFQLSSDGEELSLTQPDGVRVDVLPFPAVPRDASFGRPATDPVVSQFFAEPTPGRANTTAGSTEFLAAPAFSHPAGFHTASFGLVLSTSSPGADIRYTLDGSEPTESSVRYTGPIQIRSRAGTPNGVANVQTTPGGPVPAGEVFKGWPVRARAFKAGALPSAVVTRTFFLTPAGAARYRVPVVSVTTEPGEFFSADRGIYVPGNAVNYNQRGPEWERPVFVEMFETNNSTVFAQPAGAKIHGNTSQNFPIKGLDLDATQFTGRAPFQARLFPDRDRTEFEHVLLRPTGHDQTYAFMRDELMQSLAAPFGVEFQAARLVVVFINGEYWGLHYLKEKEDAEFLGHYGNVPPDELDFLEGYVAPRSGDLIRWNELAAFLQKHDLTAAADYAWVSNRMETANYALYKATESFTYRWDIGNHRFWRPRTADGRFRWLQFDNDVGWGGFWAEQPAWDFDMLAHQLEGTGGLHGHSNGETTFLFSHLMASPWFRREFLNVYADLLNSVYRPEHSVAEIDARAAVLAPEMAEHIRRWRAPGSVSEWEGHVEYLRTFARQRPGIVRQQLIQRFGLRGTVTLTAAATAGGVLKTALLTVTNPPSAPWSGTYFRDNALTVTALPRPGWRLSGWTGIPGYTSPVVTLAMNADVHLEAKFEPIEVRFTRTTLDAAGHLVLEGTGRPGLRYVLEASSNLSDWEPEAFPETDAAGNLRWTLPASPAGIGFFRLRPPP